MFLAEFFGGDHSSPCFVEAGVGGEESFFSKEHL